MHPNHSSLGAASVARLAPIGLAALLVVALVSPSSPSNGEPTAHAAAPSPAHSGTTAFPYLPTISSTTYRPPAAVARAKPVAGAPLIASTMIVATGIPATAMAAYQHAADVTKTRDPQCGIAWSLLAGIGRVESDHGQFGGAVLYSNGLSSIPIIGPALNGNGTALIADTDHGVYDHDTTYDHAVGPMQFIPSTWARWGADGNGDGKRDPFNIYDAALAAAGYLCAAGGDLRTVAGQTQAVFAYNHVASYVAEVLALAAAYAAGHSGAVIPPIAPPSSSSPAPRPSTSPGSPHPTPSPTCPTPSPSPSTSPSPSGSTSGSPSGSASDSPSPTPSGSTSPSPSGSPSTSPSTSPSPSPSCS